MFPQTDPLNGDQDDTLLDLNYQLMNVGAYQSTYPDRVADRRLIERSGEGVLKPAQYRRGDVIRFSDRKQQYGAQWYDGSVAEQTSEQPFSQLKSGRLEMVQEVIPLVEQQSRYYPPEIQQSIEQQMLSLQQQSQNQNQNSGSVSESAKKRKRIFDGTSSRKSSTESTKDMVFCQMENNNQTFQVAKQADESQRSTYASNLRNQSNETGQMQSLQASPILMPSSMYQAISRELPAMIKSSEKSTQQPQQLQAPITAQQQTSSVRIPYQSGVQLYSTLVVPPIIANFKYKKFQLNTVLASIMNQTNAEGLSNECLAWHAKYFDKIETGIASVNSIVKEWKDLQSNMELHEQDTREFVGARNNNNSLKISSSARGLAGNSYEAIACATDVIQGINRSIVGTLRHCERQINLCETNGNSELYKEVTFEELEYRSNQEILVLMSAAEMLNGCVDQDNQSYESFCEIKRIKELYDLQGILMQLRMSQNERCIGLGVFIEVLMHCEDAIQSVDTFLDVAVDLLKGMAQASMRRLRGLLHSVQVFEQVLKRNIEQDMPMLEAARSQLYEFDRNIRGQLDLVLSRVKLPYIENGDWNKAVVNDARKYVEESVRVMTSLVGELQSRVQEIVGFQKKQRVEVDIGEGGWTEFEVGVKELEIQSRWMRVVEAIDKIDRLYEKASDVYAELQKWVMAEKSKEGSKKALEKRRQKVEKELGVLYAVRDGMIRNGREGLQEGTAENTLRKVTGEVSRIVEDWIEQVSELQRGIKVQEEVSDGNGKSGMQQFKEWLMEY